MRIKSIITSLLIVLSVGLGFSQSKDEAMRDAKNAANGTLNEDFDEVIKYTFPEIIELMGGQEAARETIVKTYDSMKTQGFAVEQADIVEVSDVVNEQGQYRCIVKSYNVMVMSGQRLKSTTHLLGVYDEEVKHWRFIEAKQLQNPALTSQILPDFKTELEIPEDKVDMEAVKE